MDPRTVAIRIIRRERAAYRTMPAILAGIAARASGPIPREQYEFWRAVYRCALAVSAEPFA